MEQILKQKEQKWIQNDTITKQRRIILNYIIKINLAMAFELHKETTLYQMDQEQLNLVANAYDALLFMISHIFAQNRLPAINYIAEVNHFMSTHQDEIIELAKTSSLLESKVGAIEEEKRDMQKQIEEMATLCNLSEKKDKLQAQINAQEIRVGQLKKQFGYLLDAKKRSTASRAPTEK